jgi:murein hydrolase activator
MKKTRWATLLLLTLGGWALLQDAFHAGMAELQAGPPEQIEKEIRQKRKSLKQIRRELSATREKEKEIKGKESSVLDAIERLEQELFKREKELKEMETELGAVREKVFNTKSQIRLLHQASDQTKNDLFSRLGAVYKMGRIPPETFLLGSQPYPDLLKLDKYMRAVIDFDAHLVKTYSNQVLLKEMYQSNLLRDQSLWQRSISEVAKKKAEVLSIRENKRTLLRSIQGQKVVYQRLIGELEARGRELQALVARLQQEKGHQASREAPKSQIVKGRLMAPVAGEIISHFKDKGQNGVEIGAPMGAEVRAVLPGKVLYADWFKGFGNMVIIDHGDHLFTVSAYCSQLLKKTGEAVSQGDPIALVGSAGSVKGPCLYFEVRQHGKPQNPIDWLPHSDKHKVVSLPDEPSKGKKGL